MIRPIDAAKSTSVFQFRQYGSLLSISATAKHFFFSFYFPPHHSVPCLSTTVSCFEPTLLPQHYPTTLNIKKPRKKLTVPNRSTFNISKTTELIVIHIQLRNIHFYNSYNTILFFRQCVYMCSVWLWFEVLIWCNRTYSCCFECGRCCKFKSSIASYTELIFTW